MSAPAEFPLHCDDVVELERAMRDFSEIGSSLVESYEVLTRRAERVEKELSRANHDLERKVAELDAVLRALPTGVVVRDAEGRIAAVNGAALDILGADCEGGQDAALRESLLGVVPDGVEREFARPDGSRRIVTSRRADVHDAEEQVTGTVEILDDRTEIADLTDRVHHMDKMAALGTMAAGIAHEIRNPMSAVGGFAALLEQQLAQGSKARRWASLIVAGSKETDEIVRSMLCFAKPDPLVLEPVDPHALAEDSVDVALDDEQRSRLAVETRSAGSAFPGDRIKLRQAIRNLVANAAQVQPEGGAIELALAVHAHEVVVTVDDAGPGIPPETARRVLDPFYTTRPEGTGLGLAIASTIARAHGGDLRVSPEPSPLGGARLQLRIPFTPAA